MRGLLAPTAPAIFLPAGEKGQPQYPEKYV